MIITYNTLIAADRALNILIESPLPIQYSIAILRTRETIEKLFTDYHNATQAIFEKHGVANGDSIEIDVEKMEAFQVDMNVLSSTEIEISLPIIPASELGDFYISPKDLQSISFMLDFDN